MPRLAIPASNWRLMLGDISLAAAALSDRLAMRFSATSATSAGRPSPRDRREPAPARYHIRARDELQLREPGVAVAPAAASDAARLLRWQRCLAAPDQRQTGSPLPRASATTASAIRSAELAIEFPHDSLCVRAESTVDVLPHLPRTGCGSADQCAARRQPGRHVTRLPERLADVGKRCAKRWPTVRGRSCSTPAAFSSNPPMCG
jgi:hypothetical protein